MRGESHWIYWLAECLQLTPSFPHIAKVGLFPEEFLSC